MVEDDHRIGWAGHEGCGPRVFRIRSRWRGLRQERRYRNANEAVSRPQYTDYGVNALTDVLEDPMSTFAADVDTASYTNARRELQSRQAPKRRGGPRGKICKLL